MSTKESCPGVGWTVLVEDLAGIGRTAACPKCSTIWEDLPKGNKYQVPSHIPLGWQKFEDPDPPFGEYFDDDGEEVNIDEILDEELEDDEDWGWDDEDEDD